MSIERQTTTRSTVDHKFWPNKGPQAELTKKLLLENYAKTQGILQKPWLTQLSSFQRSYRYQLYRLIEAHPDQRRSLTYALNCRPTGVRAKPYTIACQNRRVCPWCFIRKLGKLREILMAVPLKIRNCSQLLMWKREIVSPRQNELPFFLPLQKGGPHLSLKAYLTSQLALPCIGVQSLFCLAHISFQIIPPNQNVSQKLFDAAGETIPFHVFSEASDENILQALTSSCRLDWFSLFEKQNFKIFEELYYSYPKNHLLRTAKNYTNPKEESEDGK